MATAINRAPRARPSTLSALSLHTVCPAGSPPRRCTCLPGGQPPGFVVRSCRPGLRRRTLVPTGANEPAPSLQDTVLSGR
eukprot:1790624-Prymnesium_polylepis.1